VQNDWLVDPAHRTVLTLAGKEVSDHDKKVLRALGGRLAAMAALPVHDETRAGWRAINGLRQVKPMIDIWTDQVPWHEMDVDGELQLQTTDEWSRYHEWEMRKLIYQWEHMPADMVIEPAVYSPLVVGNSAFGITEEVDLALTDEANSVVSRHFHIQIHDEDDLEKIQVPVVTHDVAESERQYQQLQDIMDGVIEVKKLGANGFLFWFAPWDELIRWWGVQEAMVDLYDRPELVHQAVDKLTNAYLRMLDQFEEQDLLTLNNGQHQTGSGGFGYTDELPPPGYDPAHIRARDLWGSGAAQIFSDVSPRMHWEFSLQYELRWMNRFALNYYGCCDVLDRKMSIMEKIPNLRKVSMSPFINPDAAVANVGSRYVFSYKPNPAVLAERTWHLDKAEHELENVLSKAKAHGCVVEVIMKDISTVCYQPQRLWEWAQMATEVTARYG
jgi:hypothetical protein